MSITALAAEVGVAESTVSRFVREIGLDGYQALRLGIAEAAFVTAGPGRVRAPQRFVYEGIASTDGAAEVIAKIRNSSEQALARTAEQLDAAAFERAVQAWSGPATVVFTCMGSSSIAAEEGRHAVHPGRQEVPALPRPEPAGHGGHRPGRRATWSRDQRLRAAPPAWSRWWPAPGRTARPRWRSPRRPTARWPAPPTSRSTPHRCRPGGALYGEAVTSKWGQLLVIDALYAAFAARHFDETVAHLEETYAAGIKRSRS